MFKLRKIAHAVTLIGLVGGIADVAWADDSSSTQEPEKIYITGSSIRRSNTETAQNVQVIKKEEILESGKTNLSDYLRTLSGTAASISEQFTNSFAAGSSGIALRGLSQKNTLVLLNGRRMSDYGFAQNLEDTFVDLNIIPIAAVERVEVLKSGASAIYGSDAVAGVINIILTKDFTGGLATVGGGFATSGGVGTSDASLMYGKGNLDKDGYNIMGGVVLYHRDPLTGDQRDQFKTGDFRNQPDGTFDWTSIANYSNPLSSKTPRQAFSTCQTLGGTVLPANIAGGTAQGTACFENFEHFNTLIPKTDRINVVSNGTFQFSPTLSAFGDVFFDHNRTAAIVGAPTGLNASSVHYNPLTGGPEVISNILPPNNLSANPNPLLNGISYRFNSVGAQNYLVESNTGRISGGLKGEIKDWDWELDLGHSESHVTQTNYNSISVSGLENAIANNTYNFLNPSLTPAASDSLRAQWSQTGVSKLDQVGAHADGALFALPVGDVRGAVGVEYRHESMANNPDAELASGDVLNYGINKVNGARNVEALYAELNVPILKSLEADLAAREEKYSDAGRNFSPQVQLRYQPLEQVMFRGTASRGFRAPSLPEISNSSSLSFQTVNDPNDPDKRPNESVGNVQVANPNLKPETTSNIDWGMVVSPTKNLSFTVDYYAIRVHNAIAVSNTLQNLLDGQGPGTLVRNAAGQAVYGTVTYGNLYELYTRGVDFDIMQKNHLPGGNLLTFDLTGTYVDKLAVNTTPGGPLQNFAGNNGWSPESPLSGGGAVPRIRAALSADLKTGAWLSRLTTNYTDHYSSVFGTLGPTVSSLTTFDWYEEYNGIKNWKVYGGVTNLTNRQPPWDSTSFLDGSGPFDQGLYDPIGRYASIHVDYKF